MIRLRFSDDTAIKRNTQRVTQSGPEVKEDARYITRVCSQRTKEEDERDVKETESKILVNNRMD